MNCLLSKPTQLRVWLSLCLLCFIGQSFAQLDTIHWMPPLHSRDVSQIQDHYVYLSTPEVSTFPVTVTDGSGTPIAGSPFNISNANPAQILIGSGQVPSTDLMVQVDSLNTILESSGLIMTAPFPFYANFRPRSGVQAGSLTAKGNAGLGTTFRMGSMPQNLEQVYRNFVGGIMATEDTTVVTITDYDFNVVFAGVPTVTLDTIQVTLDAGECYVVSGYTNVAANYQGFVGALVESDKPIVISTGNMCGSISNSGAGLQDIGIDQIVPVNQLGTEYILIEGDGVPIDERPMVVAHYDNTEIYVNGGAVPVATINAGDFYLIDNTNYVGVGHQNMYVETSEPAYMFQPLAGAPNEATPGLNFIPPFSCNMPKEVDLIPAIDSIGATAYSGAVIAFTEAGSVLEVNGIPQAGAEPITGLPDWETYKITGFSGNVRVTSTGATAVGMFGFTGNAGFGGYFSGFGALPSNTVTVTNLNPGATVLCLEDSMLFEQALDGNPISFQWDFGDGTTSTDTSVVHLYDSAGLYTYTLSIEYDCFWDTVTGTVDVQPIPTFELGPNIDLCVNEPVTVGPASQPGFTYLWSNGETTTPLTVTQSTNLWLIADNGACQWADTMSISIPGDFALPNVFTPNGDGVNDVFELPWLNVCKPFVLHIYDRWGVLMFHTENPHVEYWDGKAPNGKPVSAGTYYFTLKSDDEEYKGPITVVTSK